jgi:peptidoglycan/LPS O-acetylase OafA/YrhL
MPPTGELRRNAALDGLRGVAILMVVIGHAGGALHAGSLFSGGHLGVQVFFVLSGFLITGVLLAEARRTGRVSLSAFYIRRGARLLPALTVAGGVSVAVLMHGFPWQVAAWSVIGPATFTTNWLALHGQPVFFTGWAWSLAIEEQFYLVWAPVVAICVWRSRLRRLLPWVIWLGIAIALVWHAIWAVQGDGNHLYLATRSRADALLMGAAVAWLSHKGRLRCPAWVGWAAAAVLVVVTALSNGNNPYDLAVSLPLAALATALIIAAVVVEPAGRLARVFTPRWLMRAGMLSYAGYLWNRLPYQAWESWHGDQVPVWLVPAALLLIWLLAEASWRWVESPVINWAHEVSRRRQARGLAALKQNDLQLGDPVDVVTDAGPGADRRGVPGDEAGGDREAQVGAAGRDA